MSVAAGASSPAESLSALIKKQTEEFSAAGKRGDKAVFERLLDDSVVFTNENGAMPTKREMIEGLAPASDKSTLEVTNFKLVPQGNVATATFIDVLKQDVFGRTLQTDFQSTETWAKRGTGWRMVASHTMVAPREPKETPLTPADLDEYVGTYRANDQLAVNIDRVGNELFAAVNGGARRKLAPELPDVFFVPGLPALRRVFLRNRQGRVSGYLLSINGNDMLLSRAS